MIESVAIHPAVLTLTLTHTFIHLHATAQPYRTNNSEGLSMWEIPENNTENDSNHRKTKNVPEQGSLKETLHTQDLPTLSYSDSSFLNLNAEIDKSNRSKNGLERNVSQTQTQKFLNKTATVVNKVKEGPTMKNSGFLSKSYRYDLTGTPFVVKNLPINKTAGGHLLERKSLSNLQGMASTKTEIKILNDSTNLLLTNSTEEVTAQSARSLRQRKERKHSKKEATVPASRTKPKHSHLEHQTWITELNKTHWNFQKNINISGKQEGNKTTTRRLNTSKTATIRTTTKRLHNAKTTTQRPNTAYMTMMTPNTTTTTIALQEDLGHSNYTTINTLHLSTPAPATSSTPHTAAPLPDRLNTVSSLSESNVLLSSLAKKNSANSSSPMTGASRSFTWPSTPQNIQPQQQRPSSFQGYSKHIIDDSSVTGDTLLPLKLGTEPITIPFPALVADAYTPNSVTEIVTKQENSGTSVTRIPYSKHYPYLPVASQSSSQSSKGDKFTEQNLMFMLPHKPRQNFYLGDQSGSGNTMVTHHHPGRSGTVLGFTQGGISVKSLDEMLQSMYDPRSRFVFSYHAQRHPTASWTSDELHPTKGVAFPSSFTTRSILSTPLSDVNEDESVFTLPTHSDNQVPSTFIPSEALSLSQKRSPPILMSSGLIPSHLTSLFQEDGITSYSNPLTNIKVSGSNVVLETIDSQIKKFQSILISAAHNVLPRNFTRVEVLNYLLNLMKPAISGSDSTVQDQEPTTTVSQDIPVMPMIPEQVSFLSTSLPSASVSVVSPVTVVTLTHTVTVTPDPSATITNITSKQSISRVTTVTKTDLSSTIRVLTEIQPSVAYFYNHLINISDHTAPQIIGVSHLTLTPTVQSQETFPSFSQPNNVEVEEERLSTYVDYSRISDPSKTDEWVHNPEPSDQDSQDKTDSFQSTVNMVLSNKDKLSIMPSYIDRNVLPGGAQTDYRVVNVLVQIEGTASSPSLQIVATDGPSSPIHHFQLLSSQAHKLSSSISTNDDLISLVPNESPFVLSTHHTASSTETSHSFSPTPTYELQNHGLSTWNIVIPLTWSQYPSPVQQGKIPAGDGHNTFVKISHPMHHTSFVVSTKPSVQIFGTKTLPERLTASTESKKLSTWTPESFHTIKMTTKVDSSSWRSSSQSVTVSPVAPTHVKEQITEQTQQRPNQEIHQPDKTQYQPNINHQLLDQTQHRSDQIQHRPDQTQVQRNHTQYRPDQTQDWSDQTHHQPDQTQHRPEQTLYRPDQTQFRPDQTQHHLDQTLYRPNQTQHRQDQTQHRPNQTLHRPNETQHRQDQSQHRPDQTLYRPDQTLYRPDQTQHPPDQTLHQPDQTQRRPNQTLYQPDQTHPRPHQTLYRPDQTQHQPYKTQHRPDQTLYRPDQTHHQLDQTQHRPDQTLYRPDQTQHRQNQTVHRPDQTLYRPDQTRHRPNQTQHKPDETQYRPDQTQHRPDQTQHRPNQTLYRPNQTVYRPDQTQHRPNQTQQRPDQTQSRSNQTLYRPYVTQQRPDQTQYRPDQTKYRPNQAQHRPYQTLYRPDQTQHLTDQTHHQPVQTQHRPGQTQHITYQTHYRPHQTPHQPDQTQHQPDQTQLRPEQTLYLQDQTQTWPDQTLYRPDQTQHRPDQTQHRPDQTLYRPDQTQHQPDQTHHWPDRTQYHPDQTQYRPDQTQYRPDQAQHQPDQTLYRPDQTQHRPDQTQHRPDQTLYRPDQTQHQPDQTHHWPDQTQYHPDQTQYRPDQTQHRPDQAQHQPDQTLYRPNQMQYRPDQTQHQTDQAQHQPDQTLYRPDQTQYQPNQTQHRPDQTLYHPDQTQYRLDQTQYRPDQAQHQPDQTLYRPNQTQYRPDQTQHQTDQAQHQPDQTLYRPDQTQYQPDQTQHQTDKTRHRPNQTQHRPDQTQYRPDQTQYRPDQTQYRPDQAQHQPDQKLYRPDQTQYRPDQTQYRPDQTQHQPEQTLYRPDQTQYRPDRTQHQPDKTHHRPNQTQHRPDKTQHQLDQTQHIPDQTLYRPDKTQPQPDQTQHRPDQTQHRPNQAQHLPVQTQHPPVQTQHPPNQTQHRPDQTQHLPDQTQHQPDQTLYRPDKTQPQPDQTQHRPDQTQHLPVQTQHPPNQTQHRPDQTQHLPDQTQHQPDQTQNRPDQTQHRPDQTQHRPNQTQHQLVQTHHRPVQTQHRPVQTHLQPVQTQHRPVQTQHRPNQTQHQLVQTHYRPVQTQHRPLQTQHRPVQTQHRPHQTQHRPNQAHHRPIQTQHRPVQTQHRPDQIHHWPYQTLHRPNQTQTQVDQTQHRPDQTQNQPDQTQHTPNQTQHQQDQTQHRPHQIPHRPEKTQYWLNQTQHRPDQTLHPPDQTQHQVDQTQHRPDQTQHRPDQTQHIPNQTQHRPDQTKYRPAQTQHRPDQIPHKPEKTQYRPDQTQHRPDQTHHLQDQTQHQADQKRKLENQTQHQPDLLKHQPYPPQHHPDQKQHQVDQTYHKPNKIRHQAQIQSPNLLDNLSSTMNRSNSSMLHASTLKPAALNLWPNFLTLPNTTSSLFPDPSSLNQVLIQLTGRPLMSWPVSTSSAPPKSRPHPFTSRPQKTLRPSSQESTINTTIEGPQTHLYTRATVAAESQFPPRSTHHSQENRPLSQVQWPSPWDTHGTRSSVRIPGLVFTSHKFSDIMVASRSQSEAFVTSGQIFPMPILTSQLYLQTTVVSTRHQAQHSPSFTSLVTYSLNVKKHANEQVSPILHVPATVPYLLSSDLSASNSTSEYQHHHDKLSANDVPSGVTNTQVKIQFSQPENIQTTPTVTWLNGRPLLPPQRLVSEKISVNAEKVSTHPSITSTVYPATVRDVPVTVSPSFSSIDSVVASTPFASIPTSVNLTATPFSDNDLSSSLASSTVLNKLSLQIFSLHTLLNKIMNTTIVDITSRSPEFVLGLILPPSTVAPFPPRPTDTTGFPYTVSDTHHEQNNKKCTESRSLFPLNHSITISKVTNNVSRPSSFHRSTITTTSSVFLQTPLPLTKIRPVGILSSTLHDFEKEGPIQTLVHQVEGVSQNVGVEEKIPTISPSRHQVYLQEVNHHTLNLLDKAIEALKQKYEVLREGESGNGSLQVIEKFQNFLDGLSSAPPLREAQILTNQKQAGLSGPHLAKPDFDVQSWNYQKTTQPFSTSSPFSHPHVLTSFYISDKIFPSTATVLAFSAVSTVSSDLSRNPTQSVHRPLSPAAVSLSALSHQVVTLYPNPTNLYTTERPVHASFPSTTITFAPNYQKNSVDLYSFLRPYSILESAAINLNHSMEPPAATVLPVLTQYPVTTSSSENSEQGFLQSYPESNSPDQVSSGFMYVSQPDVPSHTSAGLPLSSPPYISGFSYPTYNPYSLHLPTTPSLLLVKPSLLGGRYPLHRVPRPPRPIVTPSPDFLRPRVPPPTTADTLRTHVIPSENSEVPFRNRVETAGNPATEVYRCGDVGGAWRNVFLSPSFPQLDRGRGRCVLRLLVAAPSVCQVRVDIVDATLVPPRNGRCEEQRLEVSGNIVAPSVTQYCGTDNSQHFYVHLAEPLGTTADRWVDFSVTTSTDAHQYRYKLWITQVECSAGNLLEAPRGCLQYFLGAAGVIKSFNYGGGRYIAGQEYQACVRAEPGACSITLSAESGYFGVHQLRNRAGVGLRACTKDYIILPGVSMGGAGTAGESGQRFCGGRLSHLQGDTVNRPITARLTGPVYVLTFRSSKLEQRGVSSLGLGFRLNYRQRHFCTDSSLSTPRGSMLAVVEDKSSSNWTSEDLPAEHEIEIPPSNVSISPLPLLPSVFHSLIAARNHHQTNFYKRHGLLPEDNRLPDEKDSEEQQQQQKQQQKQQPESQKVKAGERNRDSKDGTGNRSSPEPPPQAGHSFNRVSKIVSATLREVFPEFGHSLQDFLETGDVHPHQTPQQEVRKKAAGPGGGGVSTRLQ